VKRVLWRNTRIAELLGAFADLGKRLLEASCPSVRPSAWNNSVPTGRILIKVDI
jgi:hypothetical protein